jgi:hypothetical protein
MDVPAKCWREGVGATSAHPHGRDQPSALVELALTLLLEGGRAPTGQGDRVDTSAREFVEPAGEWAPAQVGLTFSLLLYPVADVVTDLELHVRAQRRPGIVHARNVAT